MVPERASREVKIVPVIRTNRPTVIRSELDNSANFICVHDNYNSVWLPVHFRSNCMISCTFYYSWFPAGQLWGRLPPCLVPWLFPTRPPWRGYRCHLGHCPPQNWQERLAERPPWTVRPVNTQCVISEHQVFQKCQCQGMQYTLNQAFFLTVDSRLKKLKAIFQPKT